MTHPVSDGSAGGVPQPVADLPLYPLDVVVLARRDATWRRTPHAHPGAEIGLCVEGASEIWVPGGGRVFLRPGDAYIVPSGVPHGAAAGPRGCALRVVHVQGLPEALLTLAVPVGAPACYSLSPASRRAFGTYVRQILRALAPADLLAVEAARAAAASLAAMIVRQGRALVGPEHSAAERRETGTQILRRALELIDERLIATPDSSPRGRGAVWRAGGEVARVADALSFSPAHLRRVFHAQLGMSPKVYLQRRRLDLARVFLAHTDLSVTRIGTRLGYASLSDFTTAFTRAAGQPPTIWRREQRRRAVHDLSAGPRPAR